jgi:hypothetical protein
MSLRFFHLYFIGCKYNYKISILGKVVIKIPALSVLHKLKFFAEIIAENTQHCRQICDQFEVFADLSSNYPHQQRLV